MRAVNLIPSDARRIARGGTRFDPAHAVIAVLAVALLFVTIYTLTSNTISSRKAKLAALQAQLVQEQAQSARLANYVAFEQLAQTRAWTRCARSRRLGSTGTPHSPTWRRWCRRTPLCSR